MLEKGWVFFRHGIANAILMGVDWPEGSDMTPEQAALAAVEAHCRRCGGHLGHIVMIENQLLHCINGASLTLTPPPG
ncbi:bifunctional methionine sulfoxide reductase B/A protein [Pseudoruegeria aquimaris]|uniref:peptide-methionine (R)-S-oxide reductase n=1 Tax=Pseudoruegeria aquimaris TaxID=393663 RepID=A0A1Y5T595_9RHOB|nr:bifunctional methionine sulfoxide reductase B/A protein [Pseudoruegeria aquimaris]